jgi:DNA replication and repair protein RecF
VFIDRLWLTDFRNYRSADLRLAPEDLTVVVGGNGAGKTNLLEAVGYLATLASFRNAPADALVRAGCERGIVRANGQRGGRTLLLECEVNAGGRDRVWLNRRPLRRARDLLGALRVSVFAPDDLVLVKGGPGERRRYLDDLLVALHPSHDALRGEVERVVRQRNALLRQAAGRLDREAAATLEVWDAKLAETGERLVVAREELVARLRDELTRAYRQVAGATVDVAARYVRSWEGPLAEALARSRADDVRRGITLVGPHRDELTLAIAGLPARSHASQGEQRCLTLALRLGGHQMLTAALGEPPVLLLDDVFSELDPGRSEALLAHLPGGQALLTTTGAVPPGARPGRRLRIGAGAVIEAA